MISVITPVYNNKHYVEACIKNVIEQKCQDVEHIIVDGGSTDGTVEIIRYYAEQNSHILWLSEKDKGQSDAMNKGIHMAHGDVLSFLNVDDFYEPFVLQMVLDFFAELPEPSFLVGNCKVWDDNGELKYIDRPKKINLMRLMLGPNLNPLPVNPSAYFYHKSLHEKIGFYDIEDHYTLDLDFIMRMINNAKIKYVNLVFGNYRFISGTKTYEDIKNGESYNRYIKCLDKYKYKMNFFQNLIFPFYKYYMIVKINFYRKIASITNEDTLHFI